MSQNTNTYQKNLLWFDMLKKINTTMDVDQALLIRDMALMEYMVDSKNELALLYEQYSMMLELKGLKENKDGY